MPRLTSNRENGLITRSFSIPPDLLPFLTGAIAELSDVRTWAQFGDRTVDECAYFFEELLNGMQNQLLGAIFPTVSVLPEGCLWCDGTFYFKEEYPALYEVIDPTLKDGAGFQVPDLTGRFLYGSATIGQTGGEENHTLTILEIPSHSHNGHTHIPGEGTGELPTPIPDMPIPDPLGSAGGGMAHNNMPPYYTVRYYIVAR